MKAPSVSRRSFVRVLAGVFAFVPAARSLAALPTSAASQEDLKEMLRSRIAKGTVTAVGVGALRILDRYTGAELTLAVTDQSVVWKGKYNAGNNFSSYPHTIQKGDRVIALGKRTESDFTVDRVYVNHVNMYVTIGDVALNDDGAVLSYTDGFSSYPEVANRKNGTVIARVDYLIHKDVYQQLIAKGPQLRGSRVQVFGLPLADGTVIASNLLFAA